MKTERLYYNNSYLKEFEAKIISCVQSTDKKGKHAGWDIILDRTAFYPEGGGQPFDTGVLVCEGRKIKVTEVREEGDVIHHIADGKAEEGSSVHGIIDWNRRFDHMQQHSGEHIASGMICSMFGCDNVGFHLGSEFVTIDYNKEITWDELLETEENVNRYLYKNAEVSIGMYSEEELKSIDYRSKKEIDGSVRLVEFPGADCCACCGTHVKCASEAGPVKFLSVQKYKGGSRIEMLSGMRAYRYLSEVHEDSKKVSQLLSVKVRETAPAVEKLKGEIYSLNGKVMELSEKMIDGLSAKYADAGDVMIIENGIGRDVQRKLADAVAAASKGMCVVFSGQTDGYGYTVVDHEKDTAGFVKEMNAALDGKGGGRNGFASGFVRAGEEEIRRFFKEV